MLGVFYLEIVRAQMRLVTPLVLGGADPSGPPELRAPAFKGLLRYWYRAVDPAYQSREARVFGGVGPGEGQACFLLRVTGEHLQTATFHLNERRDGKDARAGLRYLTYSLTARGRERLFFKPGQTITLHFLFKKRPGEQQDRRAILASIWLLGHLGGAGARIRRGMGTVALTRWSVVDPAGHEVEAWPEMQELPIAHGAASVDEWLRRFESGLSCLQRWFGEADTRHPTHTTLGPGSRFVLLELPPARRGEDAWENALNEAGLALHRFRLRRGVARADGDGDYHRAKRLLLRLDPASGPARREAPARARTGREIAPERVAFGLPLQFRFRSLQGRSIMFRGKQHDRSASRLWIRPIDLGDRQALLFALLPSPLLAPGEPIRAEVRRERVELDLPGDHILMEFLDSLSGREVTWPCG